MTAISDALSATTAASTSATGKASLGKEDFLQLLIAQLQNQDPLNPSDPTEFTAQLAQFSSLEQLTNVNESLTKMAESSLDMERLSALGMIGREVVSDAGTFRFDGNPVDLGYNLDAPAEEGSLYVLSQTGAVVGSISLDDLQQGTHFISWDGTGSSGLTIPNGEYTLQLRALDKNEDTVDGTTLVKGTVTGVELNASGTLVTTSAGDYKMKNIQTVREI